MIKNEKYPTLFIIFAHKFQIMITLDDYIEQHSSPQSELLQQIYRDTNVLTATPHMLSGHIQGRLLAMISYMIRPKRILELGTFTGYSALCLAEGLQPQGRLDTIEKNDELEDMIVSNLSRSKYAESIKLHIADALEIIPQFADDEFDLVFIDADKRHYIEYYDAVLPKVRVNGFILADNTLWDGHIIDPAYQKDWQTRSLRAFNDMVANDDRVEKVILPIRDGLTIIRKLR